MQIHFKTTEKMKYNIYTAGLMLLLVSSCGNNSTEEKNNVTADTTPVTLTPTSTSTNSNPVTVPASTVPVSNPAINTAASVQATASTAGLNPAHGQPGHRCDIAVGAPLDSKPAETKTSLPVNTTPSIQTTPVVIGQPAQPATASKTTAGLNPAHGQPGHRCDISVGAPLDSKPTVINATAPPATTSTNSKVPVINTSSTGSTTTTVNPAPATAVAPGMNPSHGQPGHRCDIAVGAPLPKQ
ncbi:MAG: hypothetical protein ABIR30_14480 [Chitinophagaceae bacterium]